MADKFDLTPEAIAGMKRIGSALKSAALSFQTLAQSFGRIAKAFAPIAEEIVRQHAELREAEWWKRGESEPEYVHRPNEREWWERDDEPPSYGMAI